MKILFLGYSDSPLIDYLRSSGDEIVVMTARLTPEILRGCEPDWIVSYGYRYIISPTLLALYPDQFINLHIAYLPWNRGADPNLWSWIGSTPKGVTIHYIDKGVDTGDIIAQREVAFGDQETLASSYARLQAEIQKLFREVWPGIKAGVASRQPQVGKGSYHCVADRERVEHLLTGGYDTPTRNLRK
mgnify:CR=1 FL=1